MEIGVATGGTRILTLLGLEQSLEMKVEFKRSASLPRAEMVNGGPFSGRRGGLGLCKWRALEKDVMPVLEVNAIAEKSLMVVDNCWRRDCWVCGVECTVTVGHHIS